MNALDSDWIETTLHRQDQLYRHQPKCQCGSDQVQLMDKKVPAQWRCRICKFWFTDEPTGEK